MPRKKEMGDISVGLRIMPLRERHRRQRERQEYELLALVKEYRESGASITALCEMYGTTDRSTIIAMLRRIENEGL